MSRENKKRENESRREDSKRSLENLYRDPHFGSLQQPALSAHGARIVSAIVVAFCAGVAGGVIGPPLLYPYASSSPVLSALLLPQYGGSEQVREVRTTVVSSEDAEVASLVNKVVLQSATLFHAPVDAQGANQPLSSTDRTGNAFAVTADGWLGTSLGAIPENTKDLAVVVGAKRYEVRKIVRDPFADLAYIKVDATDLVPVTLANSSGLSIGDTLVVPDPFAGGGVRSHVSGTSFSLVDPEGESEHRSRAIRMDEDISDSLIGSGAWTLGGELQGIVNDTHSLIPASYLKEKLSGLLRDGSVTRPLMGVRYFDASRKYDGSTGLVVGTSQKNVSALIAKGPAEAGGVKTGDRIVKLNDDEINTTSQLPELLQKYKPGDTVHVTVERTLKSVTLDVTLGAMKP